ncbi:PAS domain S-box protein [Curvibacter sp. HBC61]|uniref:histidine kinase n=1 Tax=Curvibacter cyanobacteriorum TaxID=3026422 RepID=A0ABT5N2D0_9BURK|nr:PAS domain S-box protein [Curvibacter sp. HBC61]MDD0839739.1 PAS domain S-box protein [Curvibacter sp. HBC61]
MPDLLASFFLVATPETPLLQGQHDPWLVGLSVVVAMLTSAMALQLAGVARRNRRAALSQVALGTGALTLGAGVWAMHFIGMLAFELCTTVRFNPGLTLGSMLPSLGASYVALRVLSKRQIQPSQLLIGGTLVGAGIGLMHYSGMAAMEMGPVLRYDPWWFLGSIAVAVVLAVLALWIRFELRRRNQLSPGQAVALGGMVMGMAIAGMHYMAMGAARFVGQDEVGFVADLSRNNSLALTIALITLVISMLTAAVNAALRYRQIYRELTVSEARLQAVLDTAVDGVISMNPRGEIQAFNPAAERIFGWRSAEVRGRPITDLLPDLHDGGPQATTGSRLSALVGSVRELDGLRRDGSRLPVRLAIGHAADSEDSLWVGFVTDLTERRRIEDALAESEQQHRSLIANIPGATFRCRYQRDQGKGELIFVSDAIEAMSGWPVADFLHQQRRLDQLVHPIDRERVERLTRQALQEAGAYVIEYRLQTAQGEELWVSETAGLVRDSRGQANWVDGILMDVTQSKLRNADFEGVVQAIRRALVVIEFDLHGTILNVNQNFLQLTGYQAEELVGQPHRVLCLPEDADHPDYAAHWAALRRGEFRSGEFHRLGKHKKDIWIHATYNPILDVDGAPSRVIKFVNDLSERHAMEQDLRLAKDKAEQAAASKSTFLANMSHEIRTPMNAIIGFTEVVLESPLSDTQRQHLNTINRSARSLLSLLNDILDTAKMEHGSVQLEVKDFSLRELCHDLLATLRLGAASKGLGLHCDYPDELPSFFRGDALRLQQVMLNLLGNAIKFTEKGEVRLTVRRDGETLVLAVRDTGIGIPADRLERIFDPFSQADASMTRRFGGTGLGTTIARQLVQLMGGEIQVTSTLGEGSEFTVQVPLPLGQAPLDSPQELAAVQLPPLRILVADDVPQNLELLSLRLGRLGHEVSTAQDGEQACAQIESQAFDVVLMDVQMPRLDGLAATRRVREWERRQGRPPVPVIALTASVLEEDRRATEDAGMNGFAVKPVDLARLLAEIARVTQLGQVADLANATQQAHGQAHDPEHDGVDWARGSALWGDVQTLVSRIRQFLTDTLQQLPPLLQDLDDQTLKAQAHRLHGAAANLALPRVQAMAAALEQSPATGPEQQVAWLVLQAEMQALLDQLPGEPATTPAPKTAAPHAEPAAALNPDDVRELIEHLQRGELPDAALQRLSAALDAPRREALQNAIDGFDFDQALALAQQLPSAPPEAAP